MIFNSVQYLLFLGLVLLLFWSLPRRPQNALIVVASYVFYGAWDPRFLTLIWISTLVDYVVGRRLGATERPRARRALLLASVGTNLGILGFFKYAGFFSESFAALVGRLGYEASPIVLDVVLPVGISFYTFQTMSYTIDVYRRRFEPTDSPLDFAAYVAFFPQLVAGPIERAGNLLPQFREWRTPPDAERIRSAVGLIALGLVMKVALADAVAPLVDETFAASDTAGWWPLLLACYGFSVQIYCDFAGYTHIARGSARLLGFELMRNFEQPYLSRNITDFWRTWHISLSSWLRDYLYIPLGGNRRSPSRTGVNLMLTMLLGGLWHGAAWTFVAWGGLHGLMLAAHRRFRTAEADARRGLGGLVRILVTFHAVTFAWIFFRAGSFTEALQVVGGIATLRPGEAPAGMALLVLAALAAVVGIDLAQRRVHLQFPFVRWRPVPAGLAYGVGVVAFLLFSGQPLTPFIYFQF